VAPHIRNPEVFDALFRPTQFLKLCTICIGPFNFNPDAGKGTKIEIKLYDFCHASFFENALLDSQNLAKKIQNPKNFTPSHYNQKTVFDSIT